MEVEELTEDKEEDRNETEEDNDDYVIKLKTRISGYVESVECIWVVGQQCLLSTDLLGVEFTKQVVLVTDEVGNGVNDAQNDQNQSINQHIHEVLTIHEPNTIVDPWTMMIHIQYTPTTG